MPYKPSYPSINFLILHVFNSKKGYKINFEVGLVKLYIEEKD